MALKSPFTGFWWIVLLLVIGAGMIIYATVSDGRFDPWYLLVPGIILAIGVIQIIYKIGTGSGER
jgi:hypothetical protein